MPIQHVQSPDGKVQSLIGEVGGQKVVSMMFDTGQYDLRNDGGDGKTWVIHVVAGTLRFKGKAFMTPPSLLGPPQLQIDPGATLQISCAQPVIIRVVHC